MLEDERYSYLAEDFSILSSTGSVYFSPKTLSIYASDLRGSPRLLMEYVKKYMKGPERKFWLRCREQTKANPMRKVPPVQVLGESRLCDKTQLGAAFFLVRGQFDKIEVESIDGSEFAERSMDASYRELKTLSEIVSLGRAVAGDKAGMPKIEELRAGLRTVFEKAVLGRPCYLLNIPYRTDPSKVSIFLAGRSWW